jgi:hypothetical protein
MSAQSDPIAVAVARAHVEAWSNHDYDQARASLAPDVHVLAVSVDRERRAQTSLGSGRTWTGSSSSVR